MDAKLRIARSTDEKPIDLEQLSYSEFIIPSSSSNPMVLYFIMYKTLFCTNEYVQYRPNGD